MNKIKMIFIGLMASFSVTLNAQDLPLPSPKAEVAQTIGLTNISVIYHRPGVKDRAVFGELVPYGKVWRTGANKATAITFNTPVKFAGQVVAAGSYSIFTVPGKKEWKVMLNEETELWGAGDYDASKNIVEFTVPIEKVPHTESFLIWFDAVKSGEGMLKMAWAKTGISIPLEVDYMEPSVENIKNEIEKLSSVFRVYNNAASFYLDNDLEPKKALEYAKLSVENEKRFWNIKTLSEAYAANGNYEKAIETAEESKRLAEEANYAPYVKSNEQNIEKWKKEMK